MARTQATPTKSMTPASKPTTRKASAATTASPRAGRSTPRAKLTRCGFPSEFQCSSGELLWGHVNTVIEGAGSATVDTPSGPKERLTGGTILQSNFSYRVAAKRGTWKVREVQVGDYATVHVCHHASVDPADLVQRVSRVGISHSQAHGDRRIVYVNRYDWSWHHRPGAELVKQTLAQPPRRSRSRRKADDDEDDEDDEEDSEHLESLVGGRFLLLDKDGYDALLATLAAATGRAAAGQLRAAGAGERRGVWDPHQ
ncbi:hypothetical protein PINS_up012314 [Pythium insidiosum]|nr:hypothetical protein PINS_up012314 [Pythium insidiosum]